MTRLTLAFAALALTASAAASYAQMPTDNDAWRNRCAALANVSDPGHAASAKALTHGVSADKYISFAMDRSNANQPAVACTLFRLGAIAASDASTAQDSNALAAIEVKTARHQDTSFSEGILRMKAKAREIRKPALTVSEEEAMMAAATTIPVSQLNTATNHGSSNGRGF